MTDAASPISRPVVADDLAVGAETIFVLQSTAEERAVLARRFGLPGVEEFSAEFRVAKQPGGRVRVEGEVRARLTRVCVVTLEPFEVAISEPVAIAFASEAEAATEAARAAHEPALGETLADRPDPPDPILEGRIDLGAIATEFLALALDPYPRKPGAAFSPSATDASADESPFAALARLKRDDK